MASDEHKILASFIKKIHCDLRKESQIYGATEAWKRHISQRDILQNYAVSMQALATKHWAKNSAESKRGVRCRIDWIKARCMEYFFNGGKERYREKEMRIKWKVVQEKVDGENTLKYNNTDAGPESPESDFPKENVMEMCRRSIKANVDEHKAVQTLTKIKLLDVGSCYNPLGKINIFDVTAIDLTPFCNDVLQCDFLSLKVDTECIISDNARQVIQLVANSFDVVVFCLLLEYLPCPEQRYTSCEKAYNLLSAGGILLIITPDSKHVGANAKIMKSWRFVLSKLGFMRIKYEKLPHTHCLIFRKCIFKEASQRWADMQVSSDSDVVFQSHSKIYIPQDLQENWSESIEIECKEAEEHDINDVINTFKELPCMDE